MTIGNGVFKLTLMTKKNQTPIGATEFESELQNTAK